MHRRLLTLARSSGFMLTLTIALGWGGGILTIVQAWFLARVVNDVFLGGQTRDAVLPLLGILLGALLLKSAFVWGADVSANAVAQTVKADLRTRLLNHLAALGPAYTGGERTGELSTAAVEGIEQLDAYFSQYLPAIVLAASIPLTILLVVFPIDLLTGIVFIFTAPLIPFFMVMIGKAAEALTKRQYTSLSRLSSHFFDVLQGLTTLKTLGQARGQTQVIGQFSERYRDITMQVLRVTFLSALALELLATISVAIVAVEIGFRLLYRNMDFLPAFFLLVLAPDFYQPLRNLGLRFHAGMSGVTAATRIYEILDTPLSESKVESQKSSADFRPSTFDLRLESVSFTYPTRQSPALEDISLEIPSGKMTALIGPSGSGKSTLASLLLRFIVPQSGQILVGEMPLEQIPPDLWREQIAWVPQNPYLFSDSLASNLRLAKPDAPEADLLLACQRAGLEEFIAELPEGLDTQIGERGARLSGGQAQRLALARAFLKDAPILLLDEPTSSLDPTLESQLEAAVRELTQNRTVLVIAHRLATIRQADQVIVLEAGKIRESGSPADLLARQGIYANLVKGQRSNVTDFRPSTFDF
jgi:ATP-binding cassette, subfamily C, bacterial CydD